MTDCGQTIETPCTYQSPTQIRTELFEPDFVKFGDGINEPAAWAALELV